jgi:hypothetical protein
MVNKFQHKGETWNDCRDRLYASSDVFRRAVYLEKLARGIAV